MIEEKPAAQEIREELAKKQLEAEENTPAEMELLGWMLDGWISPYTLLSGLARPVYAFKEKL